MAIDLNKTQKKIDKALAEDFDYEPHEEFNRCEDCDGHDACLDFGCAFENGCGHLVVRDISKQW